MEETGSWPTHSDSADGSLLDRSPAWSLERAGQRCSKGQRQTERERQAAEEKEEETGGEASGGSGA